jgi:hypothetical protein
MCEVVSRKHNGTWKSSKITNHDRTIEVLSTISATTLHHNTYFSNQIALTVFFK